MTSVKERDLAGPGIGSYEELATMLPRDYRALLSPKETMRALYAAKRLIEDRLCYELGLTMVQVPLIVDAGERRQRLSRPRRLAHARRVPHLERPRPPSGRRRGRAGGDEVEAARARASSTWVPARG